MDREYVIESLSETECLVTSLFPYSEYQFIVMTKNSLGQKSHGAVSEWIRTDEAGE